MKFKVGDKVKVIDCKTNGRNCKNLGKIFIIKSIDKNGDTFPYALDGTFEYFGDNELELVNEFTKADLKENDIVTYRNGEKRIIMANILFNEEGRRTNLLLNYNKNLKHKLDNEGLNIIKVERPVQYETVFERKEEILDKAEKRYLAGVIRPFRDKVSGITKEDSSWKSNNLNYINILVGKEENISLPYFKKGSMYKGMEEKKKYTLKELGL